MDEEAVRLVRPHVEALDDWLGHPSPVLDHGFVRVIDYMGDEAAIVQSARVSYGKGTKTPRDDRGLIRYLMRHWHSTPFEMCEIKLHVKLPVFVARQWIRHRTANVNEYSARYSILDREFYVPDVDDIQPQSKTNNQGRDGDLPEKVRFAMRETIRQQGEGSYQLYEELIHGWPWFDEEGKPVPFIGKTRYMEPHEAGHGMARELARVVLPPNVYTQWYWKVDLHNLLHFLRLRADPHAQYEIRVYAETICRIVQSWVPSVWEAFEDYQLHAVTFSRQEMEIVRRLISTTPEGELGIPQQAGLSHREMAELQKKLGIDCEDR